MFSRGRRAQGKTDVCRVKLQKARNSLPEGRETGYPEAHGRRTAADL